MRRQYTLQRRLLALISGPQAALSAIHADPASFDMLVTDHTMPKLMKPISGRELTLVIHSSLSARRSAA